MGGYDAHGKGKGKGIPVEAMKANMGSRSRPIALLILKSRHSMEVSGQLHAPAALPPGKESRYPCNKSLDGSQGRSGRFGEDRSPLNYRDSNPVPSSP